LARGTASKLTSSRRAARRIEPAPSRAEEPDRGARMLQQARGGAGCAAAATRDGQGSGRTGQNAGTGTFSAPFHRGVGAVLAAAAAQKAGPSPKAIRMAIVPCGAPASE